jgi:hypothetical protein
MTLPKGWKPKEETPILLNEETIWRGHVMKGIIHKEVAEIRLITNARVTHNNTVFNLSDLDDIIVMNQHYSSQNTKGITIGDVVFISQGKPVIIFRQIRDPQGVASLANTARKTAIQNANKIQEINIKIVKPINNEQSQKNDFLEFQSPRKIFKINYPAKWHKRDKKLPEGVWVINFTSQESLGVGVGVQTYNYTLIEWIEGNIQYFKKDKNSNFVLIESLPTTLASLSAHQIVYTHSGDQSLCVATKKENTIYFIQYRAQKEKYLKFLPIAEQMINSFQFIE